jgi:GDP-mannose 6-dehydrogenase
MRIAVFGLGYVGTVTAAGLASRGHQVVGVDVDLSKVAAIQQGQSPVVEPGLDELVADAASAGALWATDDARAAVEGADVSLVCVGTPSGGHGETDLGYIRRALEDLRAAMSQVQPPDSGFHSVVIRSTVPPGTGAAVVEPVFLPAAPPGWSVGTAMCPEFLREGCGVEDFFAPPFVVVGTTEPRTRESLDELFAFLDQEVHQVDVPTAEALKYACNAFHATKVSFANEMARIFRPRGVDSREVMRIFCEDRKLNVAPTYLRPGFAFGGSCLPKDLRSLQHMARMSGIDAPLLNGTAYTNELVVRDVVERVLATQHRRVALLGLSFKSDTDDLRESPNVELAERLIGKGFEVRIYDPIVNPDRLVGANRRQVESRLPHLNRLLACSPQEALADAEVVLVSSSDPAVLAALAESSPQLVIDLNGRLGSGVEELAGYQGVGW